MIRNHEQPKALPKLQDLVKSSPGGQREGGFFRSSLRTTIMCWFLVISLVPVIFVSLVGHHNAVQNRIEDISQKLQAVSLMEKMDLEKYYQDLQYQAASKAQSPGLSAFAANTNPDHHPGALIEDAHRELLELRDNTGAINVLLMDLQTRVVLSCDPTVKIGTNWGDTHGAGSRLKTTFEVATVSGDVVIREAGGQLEAASVSGNVTVDGGFLQEGEFETVSGSIKLYADLGDGSIEVESMSGNITIAIGSGGGDFEIETFSGSIENNLTSDQPTRASEHTGGQDLEFSTGAGSARVSISTFSGAVTLDQR